MNSEHYSKKRLEHLATILETHTKPVRAPCGHMTHATHKTTKLCYACWVASQRDKKQP